MGKQIKIPELTQAISNVLRKIYKEKGGKALLAVNNDYYSDIGKNLGLERYTSTDHNVTCSKLFAICDFLEISLSDFFKLVEEENDLLKFETFKKGRLVKKAYEQSSSN